MMQQISMPLLGFPVYIIFLSNGCVAFQRTHDFKAIICQDAKGNTECVLTNENVKVGNTVVEYGTMIEYKHLPDVLQWLQGLKLISPI